MFIEKPLPLSFLRGKTAPNSGNSRKNRSGHGPEHTEGLVVNAHHDALIEDALRTALKLTANPTIVEALAAQGLTINKEELARLESDMAEGAR